jgi:hypothetical protein
VAPYGSCVNRRFGGKYRLHLQGRKIRKRGTSVSRWQQTELSLTRGRACRLQILLALASIVIFGSESRGTREHILLSQIQDFLLRRLLRPAGLGWRYSNPPPHESLNQSITCPLFIPSGRTEYRSPPPTVLLLFRAYPLLRKCLLIP